MGICWDQAILTVKLKRNWRDICGASNIEILRWHGFGSTSPKELHIFADASEVRYWSAAYLRLRESNN